MVTHMEPLLEWFEYEHLTDRKFREVSQTFSAQANYLVEQLPRSAERTVALRKLLEAKDAAVRCAVAEKKLKSAAD